MIIVLQIFLVLVGLSVGFGPATRLVLLEQIVRSPNLLTNPWTMRLCLQTISRLLASIAQRPVLKFSLQMASTGTIATASRPLSNLMLASHFPGNLILFNELGNPLDHQSLTMVVLTRLANHIGGLAERIP